MASRAVAVEARARDIIDTAPAFTPVDVEALEARFAGVATAVWLPELLRELRGRVARDVGKAGDCEDVQIHGTNAIRSSGPSRARSWR